MKVIKQTAAGLAVIGALAACGSSIPGAINAPPSLSSTVPPAITFTAYPAPEGLPSAHSAGEMSVGTVKGTSDALVQMRYTTARIKWDDTVDPATASWSNVTPVTNHVTYDPFLWTDRVTGRTFLTLLLSSTAITSFTDDGGTTWTLTEPPITLVGFDRESIGGGPYTVPRANQAYPHATYYCMGFAIATCSRSDDGGRTWGPPIVTGPAIVMDPLGECIAVHRNVVVGPDGSVYVPHAACGSTQGMLVSHDEGVTWNKIVVPGTVARELGGVSSTAALDAAGRIYFASSEGRPVIATSADGGKNWSAVVDVGQQFGINHAEFPMLVAGDAGRAAFAFFGTATDVWHLYVSYTFDGGATWQTVDATPTDPIHRGPIDVDGGYPRVPDNDLIPGNGPNGRPDRFLDHQREQFEDFQDITVDAEGRVLVSYADGCTSAACLSADGTPADSTDSLATISRQTSGRRLFAAFDPAK